MLVTLVSLLLAAPASPCSSARPAARRLPRTARAGDARAGRLRGRARRPAARPAASPRTIARTATSSGSPGSAKARPGCCWRRGPNTTARAVPAPARSRARALDGPARCRSPRPCSSGTAWTRSCAAVPTGRRWRRPWGADCVAVIAPVGDVKDERPDAVLSRQIAEALGLRLVYKRDLLARLRATHEPQELALMERAIEITRAGHEAAARATVAGVTERDVQTKIEYAFFSNGATGLSYGSIVGSGPTAPSCTGSATTAPLQAGDLVVIDAAAEYGRYASDVTRTYPVSGTLHRGAGARLPRGLPGAGGHLRRHQAGGEHGRPAEGRGGVAQARRLPRGLHPRVRPLRGPRRPRRRPLRPAPARGRGLHRRARRVPAGEAASACASRTRCWSRRRATACSRRRSRASSRTSRPGWRRRGVEAPRREARASPAAPPRRRGAAHRGRQEDGPGGAGRRGAAGPARACASAPRSGTARPAATPARGARRSA